jgi:hypothetical protein
MPAAAALSRIDELMDRASEALVATQYFQCERLCLRALAMAHRARDYDRIARAVLPLQEARRQKRQLACDAGPLPVCSHAAHLRRVLRPGCVLVQAPLVGMRGRELRLAADRARVPLLVVVREPLTEVGEWPVVACAEGLTIRTLVRPAAPVKRVRGSPSKDRWMRPPPLPWFIGACDALSRAALGGVRGEEHPARRVDDLIRLLDAHPDDEAIHQALGAAAREALLAPPPEGPRPRRLLEDPECF